MRTSLPKRDRVSLQHTGLAFATTITRVFIPPKYVLISPKSMQTRLNNMPCETIISPFGHLPAFTIDSPFFATNIIPSLQFDDGDLVIMLGHEPKDWLIIHTKVFSAISAVFRVKSRSACQDNTELDIIKHPRTGKDVVVRTLALTIEDGTYMLHEGKVIEIKNSKMRPSTNKAKGRQHP